MKELSDKKWVKEVKEVISNTNRQIAEYQKKAKSDWEVIMSSSEVSTCTDNKSKVEF